jgi:hypothetical protein
MRPLALALSLSACGGPLGPPDALFKLRVDVDELPDLSPVGDFSIVYEGEVTSLSFAAQAERLTGFDIPESGFTMATIDGGVVSVALDVSFDGVRVEESFDVAVGQQVRVTYAQIMPFWTEPAVLVEDADGFVGAGVEGRGVRLEPLVGRLDVATGSTSPQVFRHPCGRGRHVRLEFLGDDRASVPTNESGVVTVDGSPVRAYNVGSWVLNEQPGTACLDFSPPWNWAAWR